MSVQKGYLLYSDKIVIPEGLKNWVLSLTYWSHPVIVRSKIFVRSYGSYVWWKHKER